MSRDKYQVRHNKSTRFWDCIWNTTGKIEHVTLKFSVGVAWTRGLNEKLDSEGFEERKLREKVT